MAVIMKTDSDFSAFVIDYFGDTAIEFGNNMNRTEKVNVLIKSHGVMPILSVLARVYPDELLQNLHYLELPPTHGSLRYLCQLMSSALSDRDQSVSDGLQKLAQRQSSGYRVGVIGMTSSGKSSLVNALMGSPLLPTEVRATTVVNVVCRRGASEALVVEYMNQSGGSQASASPSAETYAGDDVTRKRLQELCTAAENPNNQRQLHQLIWTHADPATMTDASNPTPLDHLIPAGLDLIDTPGLGAQRDAPGELSNAKALMQNFDACLYVISVRQTIVQQDIALLAAAGEAGIPVLLVVTKWDCEHDSLEVVSLKSPMRCYPKEQKRRDQLRTLATLWKDANSAKAETSATPELPLPACYFVSAHEILDDPLKRKMGDFSRLIQELHRLVNLHTWQDRLYFSSAVKAQIARLSGCHFDGLHSQQSEESRKENTKNRNNDNIKKHKSLLASITDTFADSSRFSKSVAALSKIKGKIRVHIPSDVNPRVDREKRDAYVISVNQHEYGITEPLRELSNAVTLHGKSMGIIFPPAPDPVPYSSRNDIAAVNAAGVVKNNWWQSFLKSINVSDNNVVHTDEHYRGYIDDLERKIGWADKAKNHFTNNVTTSLHEIVEGLERQNSSLDTKSNVAPAPMSLRADNVLALVASIERVCRTRCDEWASPQAADTERAADDTSDWTSTALTTGSDLLWGLARLRLQKTFIEKFVDRLKAALPVPDPTTERPIRVLLLGPQQEQGRRLLGLLRQACASPLPSAPADAVICVGPCTGLPSQIAKMCVDEDAAFGKGAGALFEIALAPADAHLSGAELKPLLEWSDVIGVFIEASRVSAGMIMFSQAHYFRIMIEPKFLDKLLFLFCDGALLPDFDEVLKAQIIPELQMIDGLVQKKRREKSKSSQGGFSKRPWFVFEDYCVR